MTEILNQIFEYLSSYGQILDLSLFFIAGGEQQIKPLQNPKSEKISAQVSSRCM